LKQIKLNTKVTKTARLELKNFIDILLTTAEIGNGLFGRML